MMVQNRVDAVVLEIRRDQVALPRFVHLRGLKPCGVAFGAFGLAPDSNVPEIARARLERDRRAICQTVDSASIHLAAVEDDLLEITVKADPDLRGGLSF